jgi:TRAP-type C4-dicarboxylate transport system substrate-binding protein
MQVEQGILQWQGDSDAPDVVCCCKPVRTAWLLKRSGRAGATAVSSRCDASRAAIVGANFCETRRGSALATGREEESMQPIVFRFGGYQGPSSINTRGAARFGKALGRELGARVKFELVGDVLALGRNSGDLPDMVASGELAGCYMSTVRFAEAVPELKVLELPFVVRDRPTAIRALNGPLGALFAQRMAEKTPFRALGFWDNGFRHVTNKVRPIRTPADCKGLRIRTQMSALHAESLGAMGFEPIPVDIREFVEQCRGERFQAQENPLTNTFHFGVQKLHRYITLTGHFFGSSALICNAKLYAGWPEDVKRAVDAAAKEATAFQHELAAEEDETILAKIDPQENELIRLSAAEHEAFVQAVEPVLAKHRRALDPKLFEYLG